MGTTVITIFAIQEDHLFFSKLYYIPSASFRNQLGSKSKLNNLCNKRIEAKMYVILKEQTILQLPRWIDNWMSGCQYFFTKQSNMFVYLQQNK